MNGCSVLCRNVAWVLQDSSFEGRATGRFSLADFVGSDFVKDGSWLGSPEAVRVSEHRIHSTHRLLQCCGLFYLGWNAAGLWPQILMSCTYSQVLHKGLLLAHGLYGFLSTAKHPLLTLGNQAPRALCDCMHGMQVVHATDQVSGNETTLVLVLSGPVYNASAGTLAFSVAPAAAESKPKLFGGAADSALANGQAVSLRQPAAGLRLLVRLFTRRLALSANRGACTPVSSSLPACDRACTTAPIFITCV